MEKGEAIVDMNYAAIDRGMEDLKKVEIPADWANAADDKASDVVPGEGALVEYVNGILKPVNEYKGNKLPVSAFMDHVDGTAPNGSAAYENVVSQLMFLSGIQTTVFSVTSVLSYVLTL